MASEDNNEKGVKPLTAEEQSGLRRVYEAAGWEVSFHQEGQSPFPHGFMRVKKGEWQDDISYEKIRQYESALTVRRK